MNRIKQQPDGSYHWDCSVETEYHQQKGRQGIWAILIICVVILAVYLMVGHGTDVMEDIWIPLLVIGVVLIIALPLLILWNSASDPHEQYVLTEDNIKSGYGMEAVYTEFRTIEEVVVTLKYIELSGKNRSNRIYVPQEDMEFVCEYILKRLPEGTSVRRLQ